MPRRLHNMCTGVRSLTVESAERRRRAAVQGHDPRSPLLRRTAEKYPCRFPRPNPTTSIYRSTTWLCISAASPRSARARRWSVICCDARNAAPVSSPPPAPWPTPSRSPNRIPGPRCRRRGTDGGATPAVGIDTRQPGSRRPLAHNSTRCGRPHRRGRGASGTPCRIRPLGNGNQRP